jgi:outer membrane protein assembly factor BamB
MSSRCLSGFPPPSLLLALVIASPAAAADWPMSRCDARRSATSPQELPAHLDVEWVRTELPLKPAWPDQPKMPFDAAYDPVVLGKTLFLASSRTDSVTALDTATGTERWFFHADGPVRFAPVAWEGRLYVASDDGYLYCLDAARGTLLWKFRGGPSDRHVLGNERLISTWPARGAPVVADGTVYFGAGIWPFMGIFLHALDARTGAVLWTNDGDGSLYMKQPHNADSFAGVAPQGWLLSVGDRLLIPGGRSVPACYDRGTGKFVYYRLAENGKRGGGSEVAAGDRIFVNGGEAFELATGASLGPLGDPVVLGEDAVFACSAGTLRAYDARTLLQTVEEPDRKGTPAKRWVWPPVRLASVDLPGVTCLIKAGSRLYVGTAGRVAALDLPLRDGPATFSWQAALDGTPARLVAADDRLFAVTREGRLCCFGAGQATPHTLTEDVPSLARRASVAPPVPQDAWTERAQYLLQTAQVREGYCVAWGVGSGRLIHELARQSRLHVIGIDADERRVDSVRHDLIAAGLYGDRVELHVGDPRTFALPPYLASLMVSEDLEAAGIEPHLEFLGKLFAALRPYGGVACLPVPPTRRSAFGQQVAGARLVSARLREAGDWVLLSREGALPGSANWSHEHADAGNTRVSQDQLVKAPLGLLWFGGTSHEGILPRHGHGPQPQVLDGRLIIEGVNLFRALDVYTGRLLWETPLAGVGRPYAITTHQTGANEAGSNYVSTPDGIYVLRGEVCVRLDPATGRPLGELRLPTPPGALGTLRWDYINICDNYLVGGGDPAGARARPVDEDEASSRYLAVLDRHTGRCLWSVTARSGFRHNAICLGGGRLYCIDRLPADEAARRKRRGETDVAAACLRALDLATGRELWRSEQNVFGTWLSYSARHDVLVESGRVTRDALFDEPRGMRAYRGGSGAVLWYNKDYAGPAMIHGDNVLKDQSACDLLTGAPHLRPDPLTGKPVEWTWSRGYGCNTPAASEHLLTFRSGAAGYYDFCNDGGTGNFGGFRSSCSNNLVVADGVLTAPDYTRTCTCSYQNQTSLALVPLPEAEMWTYFTTPRVTGSIKHVGINLGAPGDRRADDGLLWLNYPNVSGPAPAVSVRPTPDKPEWFRRHSSGFGGPGLPWVAASGAKGLTSLALTLVREPDPERVYTVRLHFAEPDQVQPGQRVFDVALQGQTVLRGFDMVREAGGTRRALVREFKGVRVSKELTVTLTPAADAPVKQAVLCGIEVRAEGW